MAAPWRATATIGRPAAGRQLPVGSPLSTRTADPSGPTAGGRRAEAREEGSSGGSRRRGRRGTGTLPGSPGRSSSSLGSSSGASGSRARSGTDQSTIKPAEDEKKWRGGSRGSTISNSRICRGGRDLMATKPIVERRRSDIGSSRSRDRKSYPTGIRRIEEEDGLMLRRGRGSSSRSGQSPTGGLPNHDAMATTPIEAAEEQ